MREDLPTGTVTFLFTDIEGSTRLLHELGAERYARSLAEHRRILRAAFTARSGVEVDTQGDAFFVAFAHPGEALAAAEEAQRALAGGTVRVRMGLHTGRPKLTEEGYVGVDVHRAARICAAGHGGQIVVSEGTKALVPGADLRPLGAHRLKDLAAPEPLYQAGDGRFPPLRSLNQSNLPEQPTPFEGRERELGEVLGLLRRSDVRLVTLTGPGGSGKTRLAVQAAAEMVQEQEHGVWWVGLQAVRDPALLIPALGSALGAGADPAGYIGGRRMLLALDNLEQVVAAAPALGELLASCPNLTLLATSREPLHLAAEHEYPVPPLLQRDAMELFLARARAVRPDFEPDGVVAAICDRLDRLPLAIELAAVRVRALSADQILDRLDRRLPLLTGGPRDLPERQRTLEAAIAWSHDLLSAREQQLFRRLAAFSGGWTLDAAEAVAGADLDTLQSLVDKSLVRFDAARYSMLETIREFAAVRLEASGEAEEVRRLHFDHFFALAGQANMSAEGDYGRRYDVVLAEQDNLRAAADWAAGVGDVESALELTVALENFWVTFDPFEGMRRFEALLEAAGNVPPNLRARALRCYGGSSHMAGRFDQAWQASQGSLALFREAGDERGVAILVHRLGTTAMAKGERDQARALLEQSLEAFRRLGSQRGEAQAIGSLGYLAQQEGDVQTAARLFEQSAAMVGPLGFTWWELNMLEALAECLLVIGRPQEAESCGRQALALAARIEDRQGMVFSLAALAAAAAESGDVARAGRLWGAILAEEERRPIGQWEGQREAFVEQLRPHAGPEFDGGAGEGRVLPFQDAVREALGEA